MAILAYFERGGLEKHRGGAPCSSCSRGNTDMCVYVCTIYCTYIHTRPPRARARARAHSLFTQSENTSALSIATENGRQFVPPVKHQEANCWVSWKLNFPIAATLPHLPMSVMRDSILGRLSESTTSHCALRWWRHITVTNLNEYRL